MKGLIFLMLIFSLFTNVNTDEFGWVFLYKMEFAGGLDQLKAMKYDAFFSVFWMMLLCAHIGLFGLIFLTKKEHFMQLIFWVPLLFIISSILFNILSIFLLFPFLLIWLIAIIYNCPQKIKVKTKTEVLLGLMLLFFLFAAVPLGIGNRPFSPSFTELLITLSAVKFSTEKLLAVLWIILILSNIALISLFFFKNKSVFTLLSKWIPASFLALFIAYDYIAFIYLIPFILAWAILLIKQKQLQADKLVLQQLI